MITHPTVLSIDAEAQQFAARQRAAATARAEPPAATVRRPRIMPRALIAGLRAVAQRMPRRSRPAATPR